MKILISTDTSCLINYESLNKYPISIFPLNVIIDEKEYLDGVNITQDMLCEKMRNNHVVKTSTPPLGQVIEYFEDLFEQGYDHIIHFTISSKLSSMYNLFKNVSETEFHSKITIIDSYSLSSMMLSHVMYAYEEVEKGTSVEEICKKIELRKQEGYICFIPENLTALKNGGRISPAIAAIGNTLKLKPFILLQDGELVKDSMIRIVSKKFIEQIDVLSVKYPINKFDYAVISFDSDQKVLEKIIKHLNETLNIDYKLGGMIPINICAHCGPGTIGLLVSPKINGKSLEDYM